MTTRSQLREFIVQNFYVPDPAMLSDEASLLEQGIIDSTSVLELIAFLEKQFHVTVADSELVPENLDSIANLERYVSRKLSAQP